ncbi:hypothetical protein V6N13_015163 [Hibiscus sabdariffa]|uniref:Uncharacterized protein n=1 Tax=Hibiscus sabdariffa TaxID=183260 RepID=A0ABR1ZHN3_9ROSI
MSSLPMYYISLFRMPSTIVRKLNNLMAKFFIGRLDQKEKDTLSELEGGVGVVDLEAKNGYEDLGMKMTAFGRELLATNLLTTKYLLYRHKILGDPPRGVSGIY